MKHFSSKFNIILSMIIFGTIGVFVKEIQLPSGVISMVRGFVGMIFLIPVLFLNKVKIDKDTFKKKIWFLLISGVFLGVNWMLLFESYNYTSVAVSTLCYYLAPVFVIISSPFVFGERLTFKRIICTLLSFIGATLVSGILFEEKLEYKELKGVLLSGLAAVFYALVVIMNKKITEVQPVSRTALQLGIAALTMLPYVVSTTEFNNFLIMPRSLLFLILVGVLHTGVAYTLYFGSIEKLNAQTSAILSYIDPVTAILLSATILKEQLDFTTIIGAVLILGSTLICELTEKEK